ncbi:MAG TPA: acyl-CoA dehydrogenase family protein, partial [Ilumatobacter sp.]|nr:acyl-CoA dehydrogenase family protein [Ilumatobacter sp.]
MDPAHSAPAEEFRRSVKDFLAAQLPSNWRGIGAITDRHEADHFVDTWRTTLFENGYLGVAWPKEYGGAGLSKLEQVVLVEEFARAGVPTMGYNDTFGIKMLGNTLLRWGTDAQKQWFLPRILSGDDLWCQGYSEPGAGSDLAALRTTATLDGDQ